MAAYKLINALSVGCIQNIETVSTVILGLFYSGMWGGRREGGGEWEGGGRERGEERDKEIQLYVL